MRKTSKSDDVGIIIPASVMTIALIVLSWLPILGQFIAGYVGGKLAGSVRNALIACIIPVLLVAVFGVSVMSLLYGTAFAFYRLIIVYVLASIAIGAYFGSRDQ